MECNCEILNITEKQDVPLLLRLLVGYKEEGQTGEPFPIELAEDVAVQMVSERGERVAVDFTVGDAGRVLLRLKGADFRAGVYGVDVTCRLNGAAHRAYGDSVIRYTFATVKGAKSVTVVADPYEVTLYVGYVTDIVPRKTSELVNDGADGEHPFATEQAVAALDRKFGNYIPTSQKGAAGGVAGLNAEGKVPTAQAQFALRGNLVAADIDSTALQTGFYRIIGQRLGSDILGGDEANGVLIQYSDGYKEQQLMVGRTAGAAAGEQVETYTRRYLPTPKRWTAWYKAAGGGGSDTFLVRFSQQGANTLVSDKSYQEIQEAVRAGKMVYAIYDDAVYILGYCQGGSATFYLTSGIFIVTYSLTISSNVLIRGEYILPDAMSQAEAEAGSLTVARTISPAVLKGAILTHVAPGLAAKQDKLIAGEGIEIGSDGKTISAIGISDDIYVVHIRPDGSTFTLVEPVQEVFAARDAGKTLIGIVEGVRQGGVLSYLPGNDGPGEIPLACAYEVHTGRMKYDVYTISIYGENDNVRIVKESIAFDLGKMTAAEAEAGNQTTARTIAPSVLKGAILYHTSDLVNGGAYNSTTKKIELLHGSTVVAEIDATPFIVDGMVDDVRIENGSLVIDFNTESGKQDIAIPLTDIFNPNNYYTKQQTDGLLSGKASTADVTALQQQVAGKQDTISDLAEIRAGAAAGATAVQPAALQPYATQAWVGEQGFLTQHQDISGKEDKMRVVGVPTGETSLAAQVGKYYKFADDLGTFDITLPVLTDVTTVQTIVFYMTMGSAPAITFSATQPIYYHDGFELGAGKTYEVNVLWNGAAWVVASIVVN